MTDAKMKMKAYLETQEDDISLMLKKKGDEEEEEDKYFVPTPEMVFPPLPVVPIIPKDSRKRTPIFEVIKNRREAQLHNNERYKQLRKNV